MKPAPLLSLLLLDLLALAPLAQVARLVPPAPAPRSGHAMTYDEGAKTVLLFGGAGTTRFRDLWAWDGRAWTRLANSGPSPRDDAVFVHDAARRTCVLFGGRGAGGELLADTWEWNGAWIRRNVPGPGARLHAAAAFDRAAGRMRLHGGVASDGSALTDTWEWDGSAWTRVAERGAAPGWLPNRMAYDATRRRTLLLASDPGSGVPGGVQATELWEWSGAAWRALGMPGPSLSPIQDMSGLGLAGGLVLLDGGVLQGGASTWTFDQGVRSLVPGATPTPRNGHVLACDPERARVVLFGGFRDGQDLGDTWEWDGRTWSRMSAPSGPDAVVRPELRFASAVAFDRARATFVLHGGEAAQGRLNSDTWEWNGTRWRQAAVTGPGRRVWSSMAYDEARARSVLFGGVASASFLGDTWEWDGTSWQRRLVPGPSARFAHELAWDPVRGRVVLFGGSDASGVRRDLWEWDGASWRLLADDGPAPRLGHALAFDRARGELLAFGGFGPGDGGVLQPLADLWARDASGWRALAPGAGPGPMDHLGSAYDERRERVVVLNGGQTSGPRVWEWDGSAWHAPSSSLTEIRGGQRLVWDPVRERVLLWTGEAQSTTLSRLLAWDGAEWTRVDL